MRASLSMSMNRESAEKYARNPNNRNIVAMIALFILSFLFYFLASFFGYLGGSAAVKDSTISSNIEGSSTDSNTADNF